MAAFIDEMKDKTIRARFQRNLLIIRRLIGWTTEELGQRLEVSKQTIGNWEKHDENGEVKKLIPFAQALALSIVIKERLLELANTNYSKYIYIKLIVKMLLAEDNLELEKKIYIFAKANYQSDKVTYQSDKVTYEETSSLIGNELKNIIEKKIEKENKENVNTVLFWMSKFIVEHELKKLSEKSKDLLDELNESLLDLSIFEKIDIMKQKLNELKEEFFVLKKSNLGLVNYDCASSIEATMWTYNIILNILSIPISQEQIKIIMEKLLAPTMRNLFDELEQNNQASENYIKDTRFYFRAPNIQSVLVSILKKTLIDNKEKYNLDGKADVLLKKLDRANDLFLKYYEEWNKENQIPKENFRENFKEKLYNDVVNIYGDVEKKFEEIYGEEEKSKLINTAGESRINKEIIDLGFLNKKNSSSQLLDE